MNKHIAAVKNRVNATAAHVHRNRGKYAAATTAAAFLALMNRNAKELNAFLAEHDLLDEYYCPEEN